MTDRAQQGSQPGSGVAFSENDIRPHNLDEGKSKAVREDIEWLLARRSRFVSVGCPACAGSRRIPEFEKFGFHFDRCEDCRTVYMNPRAAPGLLGEFYSRSATYDFWNEHVFPASRQARMEKIFRPRVQRILALCDELDVPKDLLLEVGAAAGMFCEEAMRANRFDRVVGIEPSASQAATCRKLGIETIESTVEQVEGIGARASVVASFETIEHLFDPAAFVRKCAELLSPGGLLVLTCPNYEGFDILTLGTISDSLDAEHINLFNPGSICSMISSQGFEIVECTTPGELDAELVRSQVLAGRFSLDTQPFLRKILIDDWAASGSAFQIYLKESRLSSHLWLVARKSKGR